LATHLTLPIWASAVISSPSTACGNGEGVVRLLVSEIRSLRSVELVGGREPPLGYALDFLRCRF